MFNWKSIFRNWRGVPVLILAVLAVLWLVSQWTPLFNSEARKIKKLAEEIERPYREDKYGGKTPEETYDLFISALKAGNIELASKYFGPDDQDNWLETLDEYRREKKLDDFVQELGIAQTKWKNTKNTTDLVVFEYETVLEKNSVVEYEGQKLEFSAGKYINSTEFHKNQNGVWKIYAL